jgi:CRISPR-associated protein Cas2
MPRKKPKLTLEEQNSLWQKTALPSLQPGELSGLDNLPEYFARFLDWFQQNTSKTPDEMYCFIMYDIQNNKVRRLVAKYLEKQGCIRVQKSVFFARMPRKMHRDVLEILRKAQNCYENQDTILVLPVGEDMLNALTCIGKNFELELITSPKHTLFF